MKKSFLLVFFVLTNFILFSQSTKYSNEFLSIGIGARGLSLSNTMTAITDDITSTYWNPAGLIRMSKNYQVSVMHAEYFAGIAKYDYAAIGCKINRSAIAFSYIRFGVDNIINTTQLIDRQGNLDYDRITYFSAADNAFLLSYAYNFEKIEGLSIGGNTKIVRRKIGKFGNSWGFGIDAGIQYNKKGWQIGLMAQDVSSTFNAWSYTLTPEIKEVFKNTGNEIPENSLEITLPKLMIGGAKKVDFGKGFNAIFALNFDLFFDKKRNIPLSTNLISFDPHLGLEFGYKKIIAIRAGIGNMQKETDFSGKINYTVQINLGVGVSIKDWITIDYAFTDIGDLSIAIYSHIFSIKVGLNSFKKSKP